MTRNQQYLLYGAGGLALAYLLFGQKSDKGGPQDPTGNGGIPNAENPVGFNAANVANSLYMAMKGSFSDQDKIIQILRTVSHAQFGQVVTAFGRKQYNPTLGNQQNPLAWFTQLDFYGLKDWLYNELDDDQYHTLRLKYTGYL